ncbi:SsrA-binding protein SmpB [bacterium]|nr:SsrA-binding protein SmpB [candidate division CSSED10-310 bacterium]
MRGPPAVIKNRKAYAEYEILETYEAGIVLQGTEVKSIRDGKLSLKEAYAKVDRDEIWLVNCHVTPYDFGNRFNHDPLRPRKLLMHRQEIRRLIGKVRERGLTLVPLKVYFKRGRVKVELGLCRGRKMHDKRAVIRDRTIKREVEREMKKQY